MFSYIQRMYEGRLPRKIMKRQPKRRKKGMGQINLDGIQNNSGNYHEAGCSLYQPNPLTKIIIVHKGSYKNLQSLKSIFYDVEIWKMIKQSRMLLAT